MNMRFYYLQSPPSPTEDEIYLHQLAEEYSRRCDEFDKNICSAINKYGESIPANGSELRKININARQVLQELKERAFIDRGLSRSQVYDFIRRRP